MATLRTGEESFQQLIENVEQVFWLIDPRDPKLLYVSPQCEKILGRTSESLYTRASWMDFIVPEDWQKVFQAQKAAQSTGLFDEEFRIIRPDGEARWVHARTFPLRNQAGEIYRLAGVASDITERKKVQAQAFLAQSTERIAALASGIAQDLNNFLASILMAAEALRDQFGQGEARAMIDLVLANARQGSDRVEHLLTFSREINGQRQALDLIALLREMEMILRQTFPRNIQLRTEIPDLLSPVRGDATLIQQILLNLCVNARDAMPNGGTLTITAKNFTADEPFAKVTPDAQPGLYVILSVRDTGTGMTPEVCARIFEPFFTTKPLQKGTGLGLSTIRGIIKSHGGFMTVHSQVARGSEFRLYLPAGDSGLAKTE
jgi:two-component system cell cycle sensor histidine kinase/response regulator CckA